MRVAMYYNNNDVRLEEMPRPVISNGEILVQIEASGICGSDVMEWYRIHKAPLVLGHEISGIVAEAGKGVERFKKGDRVVVAHHVPCGKCYYCLNGHETCCDTLRKTNFDPGGFSEFVRLPAINAEKGIFSIPERLSFEEATFTEPLACVLRGQRIIGMNIGKSVFVVGSGISGLLHIKLARALGASKIAATDISQYRLNMAKKFGADLVINADEYKPEILRSANNGRLADLVIVCTGSISAISQALQSVERGGTALLFAPTDKDVAIPISINDLFFRNDITITTSYAGSPVDYLDAIDLISSGRVKVSSMITHRFGLADTGKGFKLVTQAGESIKVIIEPQK